MADPVAELVKDTRTSIDNLVRRIKRIELKENAPSALGLAYSTYAALGTGTQGDQRKCTNCRKGGEGVGAGTGLMVYWDPATLSWLNVYNNTVATV